MAFQELILASDATRIGQDARQLAKRAKRGELVRVRRGSYVRSAYWAELNDRQRHGLQAAALVNTTRTTPIFNLQTAALLWGLGVVGVPKHLYTVTGDPTGGRSKHGVRRSFGAFDTGVVQLGAFRVTDKVRTTMELAAALNFAEALAIVDSSRRNQRWGDALEVDDWNKDRAWGPPSGLDELGDAVSAFTSQSRKRRAGTILGLSTDKSESVGGIHESSPNEIAQLPRPKPSRIFYLEDRTDRPNGFLVARTRLGGGIRWLREVPEKHIAGYPDHPASSHGGKGPRKRFAGTGPYRNSLGLVRHDESAHVRTNPERRRAPVSACGLIVSVSPTGLHRGGGRLTG
ncbi:UNVERIFIED_CONTAM: hypothetical protein ABIE34_003048 [Jeotgalibacillus campisalis]